MGVIPEPPAIIPISFFSLGCSFWFDFLICGWILQCLVGFFSFWLDFLVFFRIFHHTHISTQAHTRIGFCSIFAPYAHIHIGTYPHRLLYDFSYNHTKGFCMIFPWCAHMSGKKRVCSRHVDKKNGGQTRQTKKKCAVDTSKKKRVQQTRMSPSHRHVRHIKLEFFEGFLHRQRIARLHCTKAWLSSCFS